jgi:hypothetical protein
VAFSAGPNSGGRSFEKKSVAVTVRGRARAIPVEYADSARPLFFGSAADEGTWWKKRYENIPTAMEVVLRMRTQ